MLFCKHIWPFQCCTYYDHALWFVPLSLSIVVLHYLHIMLPEESQGILTGRLLIFIRFIYLTISQQQVCQAMYTEIYLVWQGVVNTDRSQMFCDGDIMIFCIAYVLLLPPDRNQSEHTIPIMRVCLSRMWDWFLAGNYFIYHCLLSIAHNTL